MSVQEIQALAQQFADAFDTKNIKAVLDMLSDDLEVFDHVPIDLTTSGSLRRS
jgi:ketosteroid isomerase-like protein